jgi:2-polyprenyl-3-methyl-5-hydroxy-6-metoxy-1,4-benzoquinol methylase
MEKTYSQCPSCNSAKKELFAQESFANKNYQISRCSECKLIYTSYQSDDTNEYYGHSAEAWHKKYDPILKGTIKHDRDINYLEEVSIVSQFASEGRYLDIGCNAGWLLGYLKSQTKLELYGLEPSKLLSQIASERLGIKVFNDYVKDGVLPLQYFDFMSMTDVFEHIPNPNEVLTILKNSIKPNGYLMIKVPNGKFTAMKYKLRHLIAPLLNQKDQFNAKEHLIHFDPTNLKSLLQRHGFQVKKVVVPKPIQTKGSSSISIFGRTLVYNLSKLNLLPSQDILVVAQNKLN